jgi:hypothetical protein
LEVGGVEDLDGRDVTSGLEASNGDFCIDSSVVVDFEEGSEPERILMVVEGRQLSKSLSDALGEVLGMKDDSFGMTMPKRASREVGSDDERDGCFVLVLWRMAARFEGLRCGECGFSGSMRDADRLRAGPKLVNVREGESVSEKKRLPSGRTRGERNV